ncbi:MAG: DUF6477 family protein [Pseudomonadota bacterium]
MNDVLSQLAQLRRPKLLVRAARHGLEDYNRSRDLKRILKAQPLPSPRQALYRLLDEERLLEHNRRNGGGHYDVSRHVEVMVAVMGEASAVIASPRAASGQSAA